MNNLITRCLSGSVFISLLVGAMMWNQVSFFIVFLLIETLALFEFYRLFKDSDIKPQSILGTLIGGLLFSSSYLSHIFPSSKSYVFIVVPFLIILFVVELYRKQKHPISNIAYTLLGLIYIALPLTLINEIVFINDAYSGFILLGIFLMVWAYDSFAYLFGVTLGKNKLFERISPKKSWEGFIGGSFTTIGFSYGIFYFIGELSLINWLIIAAIIISFGTFGDLVESMFKRSILIKDSGNLIPGHGGMLDRFDSVLLAVPVIFTYLYFVV